MTACSVGAAMSRHHLVDEDAGLAEAGHRVRDDGRDATVDRESAEVRAERDAHGPERSPRVVLEGRRAEHRERVAGIGA
jgi:hypothetical protein